MVNIAVIGAGQIGSRHLQALSSIDREARLQIVDPSSQSLATAKERFETVNHKNNRSIISGVDHFNDIQKLSRKIDVAIIATTARPRREVIKQLLMHSVVKNVILEKVVFQIDKDFDEANKLFEEHQVRVWVNCPFRTWPGYQALREKTGTNLEIQVHGGQWGLACNAIHYLDIFNFLTGTFPTQVFTERLDGGYIPSKRPGFVELSGTLHGGSSAGYITLTSTKDGDIPVSLQMASGRFKCTIREDLGKIWIADSETRWVVREEVFPTPRQSQLTQLVVQNILDGKNPMLPDYKTSWKLHTPLLNAIHKHMNESAPELKEWQIT